ncbi:MAG TPA: tetratricopeptide repeat protein [Thermoanaerobaculia bacterium]|jgi:hypothetical protein|nr:tetratricopeptide repeat protein [Thermoanaerobaculia bacterium]
MTAILAALVLSAFFAIQTVPTVDQIVDRSITARGGREAMARLQSLVIRGEYVESNHVNAGAVMALMRPYYKLVGDPDKPVGTFAEGYDGSAWEYYADPGIVVRTVGAASAAGRHRRFDDVLFDYKKYGTTIELLGADRVVEREAWRLLITLEDGFRSEVLIDQQTWLPIADRKAAPVHAFGEKVRSETRNSDFRPVEGVLFPFASKEVEIATGTVLNEFHTKSITANHVYDPSVFSPPEFKRTPIQKWIENLYAMRDDTSAVMWSYHDFRRAHPDADTHDAAQVAGYQMAKMNALSASTALLEANVADNPSIASAHFGVGRAYKAAGDYVKAKAEFERALAIDPQFTRAADALKSLP